MEWIPDDIFFSRRKFIEARNLIPQVNVISINDTKRIYEVGEESVILNNTKMNFSCTCKEGTLHGHKGALCPHVLAVIAKEVDKRRGKNDDKDTDTT